MNRHQDFIAGNHNEVEVTEDMADVAADETLVDVVAADNVISTFGVRSRIITVRS